MPKKTDTIDKLTGKQQAFVRAYAISRDAQAAALEAGYSAATARNAKVNLLDHPVVARAVAKLVDKANNRTVLEVTRVEEEIAKIGFSNVQDLYGPDGRMLPVHKLPRDAAAVIAGIEEEALFEGAGKDREHVGTLRKVKLHDKLGALTLAARRLRMLDSDVKINVGIGILVIHE